MLLLYASFEAVAGIMLAILLKKEDPVSRDGP